jgi:hypothetical protein
MTLFAKDGAGVGEPEYRLRWYNNGGTKQFYLQLYGNNTNCGYKLVTGGAQGSWIFVQFWTDKTNNLMYVQVDNNAATSASFTSGACDQSSTGALSLGRFNNATHYYLDGSLDEVFLYNRIPSQDEREWLYNSGAGRQYCEVVNNCATPTPNATTTAIAANATNTAIAANATDTAIAANATNTAIAANATNTAIAANATNTAISAAAATDTAIAAAAATDTAIAAAATNTSIAATATAAAFTPTYTPTNTPTSTPTSTLYPTHNPATMATAFWEGAITYGDAANVTAISLLCMVVILGLLAWLTITTLQRRKK